MEIKPVIYFIMKCWGAYTLITTTVAMTTMGSNLGREAIYNNSIQYYFNISLRAMMVTRSTSQSAEVHSSKSAVVGTAVVLDCPQHKYELTSWRIYFKNGTNCYLSYKRKEDKTEGNCSKNLNWLSRPDQKSAIRIQSLQFSSEGIYECSIAYHANGTFTHYYSLTVLAPPEVSLTYTINGNAVCKAAAGKPAAKIWWAPPGNYRAGSEMLDNGTETITSTYNTTNANEDEVACFISHPAWKEALILNLSSAIHSKRQKDATMRILYSILAGLFGILVFSFFIYIWRFFYGRKTDTATKKSSETLSTRQSIQENELEPYATFVQVENVIYDKTGDLPPAFSCSS